MKAIVYTSDTGHTAGYAKILGEKTGLPVYSLKKAKAELTNSTEIIYLGWLFANRIKDYSKAAKRFSVSAVCAVGLCDTGTAIKEVRRANKIDEQPPLFTMQGGMDKTKLRKSYRFVINMLIKSLSAQKDPTPENKRMVYLLKNDKDYVCEENAAAFIQWYKAAKHR